MSFSVAARTLLTSTLLVPGLLAFVGCNKDSSDSEPNQDGMGGALGTGGATTSDGAGENKKLLDELLTEIGKLKVQLETADEDNQKELLDRIDSLTKEIEDMREADSKCGQGGECTGLDSAKEGFRPLFQAICEKGFDCCTVGQSTSALGANVDSVEGCVEVLEDRMARGKNPTDLDNRYSSSFQVDWPEIGPLTHAVEEGRAEIDEGTVALCALLISTVECEAFDSYGYGYGRGPGLPEGGLCSVVNSCQPENWISGLVQEGAPCNPDVDFQECQDGLKCSGEQGSAVCVRAGDAGDRCITQDDCSSGSYCDIESGECTPRCGEAAPCSGDDECGTGLVCEYDDWANDYFCAPDQRAEVGQECDDGDDCKSGRCAEFEAGELCVATCSDSSNCESHQFCNEGACYPKVETDDYCSGDESCKNESDLCVWAGGAAKCMTKAAQSGDACPAGSIGGKEASRLCPEGDYCSAASDTCLTLGGLSATCDSDLACEPGTHCASNGDENVCTDAADQGEDCSEVDCAEGLDCESFSDGETTHYVCLPDAPGSRNDGEYCGRYPYGSNADLCKSERCRWLNSDQSYAICDTGLPEGSACDAQGALYGSSSYRPNLDPCDKDTYCEVENAGSGDYSGVCVPRIPAGSLCSPENNSYRMCEGDQYCRWDNYVSAYRCDPELTVSDVRYCPIKGFSASSGAR